MGRLFKNRVVAIIALVACGIFAYYSITSGMKMEWEYDMMELSAKEALGNITQNKILDKFEFSPDYAMVKAGSIEECRDMVRQYKKIGNRTGLIGQVDAITEFLPEEQTQLANAELIQEFGNNVRKMAIPETIDPEGINKLSSQLERLHKNIVEIGELSVMSSGEKNKIIRKCDQIVGKKDEDSYILALSGKVKALVDNPDKIGTYQGIMAQVLKEKLIAMASTDIVTFDNLPEDIRKRYVNPRNNDLLINVYPKGYIWEENSMKKFNEQTRKVSERITGMPALMQIMMSMMAEKGRIAIICGACAIIIFLLLDFRSITYTFLAVIPLAFGAIWMVGLMALAGMKLSMVNFMALPLIIGIGIDDGVHVLHRYRIEGRGSIPLVLKYTGRAILLTSLTTMIGFGSMGMASHRGLAGLGQTLFFGVGCCFLSSVIALPAIITLWEKLFSKK
jgi:predicted RND superfamily exporter protein